MITGVEAVTFTLLFGLIFAVAAVLGWWFGHD